jgi:hypothetical protein
MIRKAVYSFYSYPFRSRPGYAGFSTLEDFLNCWTLSVHLARHHFDAVELVTDNYGKALLVDALGLPFTHIRNELDAAVPDHLKDIYWTFGKLWAYALQDEPFIHVDYDVFLWQKPPARLLQAPMFGQNTESRIWHIDIYRQGYTAMCAYLRHKPIYWYVTYPYIHKYDVAINVGIVGGNDIDFLKRYASTAIDIMLSKQNEDGFGIIKRIDKLANGKVVHGCNVIIEQYLYASMCLSEQRWGEIEFLLDEAEAFPEHDPHIAVNRVCREVGYTHLITLGPKQNQQTMRRLRKRIEAEYPGFYARIQALIRDVQDWQHVGAPVQPVAVF